MPKTRSDDIQTLKTDVALIKKDLKYQSNAMVQLDSKLEHTNNILENLKYVPIDTYAQHLSSDKELMVKVENRLTSLEDYQEKNDPGVKFINKIFGNLTTALVLAATAAILGGLAYNVFWGST